MLYAQANKSHSDPIISVFPSWKLPPALEKWVKKTQIPKGFMFGHSVSTDGYSVTLLVTDAKT
ncbi:MAG: hypothetical protein ABEI52_08080, partial [Halobacteriaceae archaeon]